MLRKHHHRFFADRTDAYLAVNVMGSGQGIHVEKLNAEWTNGLNNTRQTSGCLSCGGPPQESPSMYKTAAGKYVVMLAGATCFGVPQPDGGRWNGNLPVGPATKPWGGTGVFVYVADAPLGPYTYHGEINNAQHAIAAAGVTGLHGSAAVAEGSGGAAAVGRVASSNAATAGDTAEKDGGDGMTGSFFCGECGPNNAPNPGTEVYQTLTLECSGSTITAIDFAKFGLPTGECGSYQPGTGCPDGPCPPYHCDADTQAWSEKMCLGRASCLLDPMRALGVRHLCDAVTYLSQPRSHHHFLKDRMTLNIRTT